MGFLDKVMFWKKSDDDFSDLGLGDKNNLAFGDDFGAGMQTPGTPPSPFGSSQANPPNQSAYGQGFGQSSFGQPEQSFGRYPPSPAFSNPQPPAQPFTPQYSQPRYDNPQDDLNSKNLEIISSKLDALRAAVESLSQRLANIEAIARGEEDQGRRRRYY